MKQEMIRLLVQAVFSAWVLLFCFMQLKDKLVDVSERVIYLSTMTFILGLWSPTPGSSKSPQNIGQVNVDSQIQSQVDNDKE